VFFILLLFLLLLSRVSGERQQQRDQGRAGGNGPKQLQQRPIQGHMTSHVQNCRKRMDGKR